MFKSIFSSILLQKLKHSHPSSMQYFNPKKFLLLSFSSILLSTMSFAQKGVVSEPVDLDDLPLIEILKYYESGGAGFSEAAVKAAEAVANAKYDEGCVGSCWLGRWVSDWINIWPGGVPPCPECPVEEPADPNNPENPEEPENPENPEEPTDPDNSGNPEETENTAHTQSNHSSFNDRPITSESLLLPFNSEKLNNRVLSRKNALSVKKGTTFKAGKKGHTLVLVEKFGLGKKCWQTKNCHSGLLFQLNNKRGKRLGYMVIYHTPGKTLYGLIK